MTVSLAKRLGFGILAVALCLVLLNGWRHPRMALLTEIGIAQTFGKCSTAGARRLEAGSAGELSALIRCAAPNSVITLKPGNYGRLTLNEANGLTLVSQDRAAPASFEFVRVQNSKRVTLSNLRFEGSGTGLQFRLQIGTSDEVKATDLDFPGIPNRFDDVAVGAVQVRGGANVELTRLKIAWTKFAISYLDVTGLTIRGCSISDVRSDGMRGGGVSDLVIAGNRLTGFHPAPGDHPDGIQIWTANQKTPIRNIRITGNLITRGNGQAAQGIFIRDETKRLPHRTIEIADNIVVGGLWNGIAVGDASDVKLTGNSVLALPDQVSWIMLGGNVTEAIARDNRAIVFKLPASVQQSGNRAGRVSAKEIERAVARWNAGPGQSAAR